MQKSITARLYLTNGGVMDVEDVYQVTYTDKAFYFSILDGSSTKVISPLVASISLIAPKEDRASHD